MKIYDCNCAQLDGKSQFYILRLLSVAANGDWLKYAKNKDCYKMIEVESKKASAIVEKKEVMDALKEVYGKEHKHKYK